MTKAADRETPDERRAREVQDIRERLRADIEGLAVDLLGEPSNRSSTVMEFGRKGSLKVVTGRSKRGLWFTHEAGQGGDALALIQYARTCSFPEALEFARRWVGMPEAERSEARRTVQRRRPDPANDVDEDAEKRRVALLLAGMLRPIAGTPAEAYLASRGLSVPPLSTAGWLPALNAADHPTLRDPRDGRRLSKYLFDHERFGCLVVVATDARGRPRAVQRTFLTQAGRKADLRVVKRSLAPVGGAAFRIPARVGLSEREADGVVVICEGVETALSVWLATGLETWVMLGSLANAREVEGLDGKHVIIAADADRDGSPARNALDKTVAVVGARAATLRLARPAADDDDWNDVHQRDGLDAVRRGILACRRVGGTEPALRPYHDGPSGDREFTLARQRHEIRAWFEQASKVAAGRRDLDEEKRAAWDAGGLTAEPGHADYHKQRAAKSRITRTVRAAVCARLGLDPKALRFPPRLLVTGAQGTGKTQSVLNGAASVQDGRLTVAAYLPTLEKCEEAAADYAGVRDFDSLAAMVVRGRKAIDPEGDGKETMCRRADVATTAAALGVNVRRKICRACPFQAACGYLKQDAAIRERGAGFYLMSHEYLFLPSPLAGADVKRDLVVVDEDATRKAATAIEFAPSRIRDTGDWTKIGLVEATACRAVADKVYRAVTEQTRPLAWLRAEGVVADDLKRLRAALNAMADHEVQGIDGAMTDAEIDNVLSAVERSDLIKVARLVGQILVEWDTGRAGLTSVVYDPAARVRIGTGDEARIEAQPRVTVHYLRRVDGLDDAPLLLVDGTGEAALAARVFGDLRSVRIVVERDAEVIQVTGKEFSRQSLTGRRSGGEPISEDRLREANRLRASLVRYVRDNAIGPTFVAATKKVAELLSGELADAGHIGIGHFGALRGVNAWEHCATAIVVGREQPSMAGVEELARAFFATDPEPLQTAVGVDFMGEHRGMLRQSRARRMRSGAVSLESVHVHPDPRVQLVLEQIREAEIAQAIDRVRPIFNRRRIIILSSVVVDATVDEVRTWGALRDGGSKLDKVAAGGLVPLSAAGLHAIRPDLWRTERAAEEWLRRAREAEHLKPLTLQIESLFGQCGVLKVGEFRRSGAKRWSPVCYDPRRIRDVGAALRDLFGCDVEVQGCEPAPVDVEPVKILKRSTSAPRPVLMVERATGTDGLIAVSSVSATMALVNRRSPAYLGLV